MIPRERVISIVRTVFSHNQNELGSGEKTELCISIRWKLGNFFRRMVPQEESQSIKYRGKW